MTHARLMKLLNELILAVRPHGHLAESVLQPLQDLKAAIQEDHDAPNEKDEPSPAHKATRKHAHKHEGDGSTPLPPGGPTETEG